MPFIDTQDSHGTLGGWGGKGDQQQQIAEQLTPAPTPREDRMFPTLSASDYRNEVGAILTGQNPVGETVSLLIGFILLVMLLRRSAPTINYWMRRIIVRARTGEKI